MVDRAARESMTAYLSRISMHNPSLNAIVTVDADAARRAAIRILKRIQPQTAANAIADGLERRQRSVIVPGRWRPVAALRGAAGPVVDARLARDAAVQQALTQLENR